MACKAKKYLPSGLYKKRLLPSGLEHELVNRTKICGLVLYQAINLD